MFKTIDHMETLTEKESFYLYDSNTVSAKFDKKDYSVSEINFKMKNISKIELYHAAEMIFLYQNLKDKSVFKINRWGGEKFITNFH